MIMRYYGGGIGHLTNTPPQQADTLTPNSVEVAAPENEENSTQRECGEECTNTGRYHAQ